MGQSYITCGIDILVSLLVDNGSLTLLVVLTYLCHCWLTMGQSYITCDIDIPVSLLADNGTVLHYLWY